MTHREFGSATIENIMWLPVCLLLLGAIVEFGLYFNARVAVQTASYEAARQGALADNPVDRAREVAFDFADGTLPGWRQGERVDVTVISDHGIEPGRELSVKVTYDVPGFLTAVLPQRSDGASWLKPSGLSSTTIEERP